MGLRDMSERQEQSGQLGELKIESALRHANYRTGLQVRSVSTARSTYGAPGTAEGVTQEEVGS